MLLLWKAVAQHVTKALQLNQWIILIWCVPPAFCRPTYWQPRLDALMVGKQNISVKATSLILDSGSTIIFAGEQDAKAINSVSALPSSSASSKCGS